ncbi:M1 family metallopeptidase [Herbiconiux sp.]|uniref:M1 family metallopeptidase n=1 Tax=Herbiconiux sp. TaxID=1871186 RepID=UPI0025BC95D5|nr:M1 family metallopeptidase [Herbiconiux sp.]
MTNCVLAATGFESWPLMLALALGAVGAGTAWLLVRRGRRKAATFAAAPLLVLALLASGVGAPPASFANAADCPGGTPAPGPTAAPTPVPTTPPTEFTAGAAGIGDAYYPLDGNGGYEVDDYFIDVSYDPATHVIAGGTIVTATASQNLSSFNLDFDTRGVDGTDSIVIDRVSIDGADATWSLASTPISIVTGQPQAPGSTDGDATPPRTELTVVPAAGIPAGTTFGVRVDYAGVPITIDDAFGPAGVFQSPDGAVIVGQPRVAATWFPANDHPSDKATFRTRVEVPTGLQVVGNGRLNDEEDNGDGTTTWDWVMDEPMATYLATATIGDYRIDTDTDPATGITYYDAIDPELFEREADGGGTTVGDVASAIFGAEPEVIRFLSGSFGDYPFREAGGIAIGEIAPGEDLPYALENQTRPIYPAWAFPADADASVVVHELAHQWYGDSLSMSRWSDIWLNEGFATYAEWLWAEHTGGPTPQQQFDSYYANTDWDGDGEPDADGGASFWSTEAADPGSAGIFDSPVYTRGAMTLQALRTAVGDDTFFAIIKGWAQDHAGTAVSTEQFIAYAEQLSGEDLDALFTSWLYTPTKPAL